MKFLLLVIFLIIISTFVFSSSLNEIVDKYIRYNKWDEAKTQLEDYISSNQTDSRAISIYSTVLGELKLYDQAIVSTKNAINYETNEEKKSDLYYNLGDYYYKKNIKEVALEMFDKSLILNKTNFLTYYMMGLIHYENNDINKCIEYWKKYVNISTNFEKKDKLQKIIVKFEQQKMEDAKRAELQKLKEEEERIRLAEEKKKKEENLKKLMSELEKDKNDSQSLEDYKINKKKTETEFDEIK